MNNYTKILHVKAIQINFDETIMNESKEIFGQHFSYYTGSVDYETGKAKGYYYINGVHCYNGYYVVKTGSEISVVPTDIFDANYTKVEDDSNYEKIRKILLSAGGDVSKEEFEKASKEFLSEKRRKLLASADKVEYNAKYKAIAIYSTGKKAEKLFEFIQDAEFDELTLYAMSKFTNRQIKAMIQFAIIDLDLKITSVSIDNKELTGYKYIFLGENKDVSASSNDNE
jgi:hypothetical protein